MIEFDFEGHAKSQIDKGLGYLEGFSKGYHQAKSEWVGLTDDQMRAIAEWQLSAHRPLIDVTKAVEQALKEKNT